MTNTHYTPEFLQEQQQFLEDLIAFRKPLEELEPQDKIGYVWDDQPEDFYLATITRQDVISVLHRFLNSELNAEDIYQWAEMLDMRETIDEEAGFRYIIGHTISAITIDHACGQSLTPTLASQIVQELQNAQLDPNDG